MTYRGAYGVSKAATEGFMQILADELETSTPVRVNSIDPGPVRTALRSLAFPGEDVDTLKAPEEVVNPYLYLLGPDSKGVGGEFRFMRQLVSETSPLQCDFHE